MKSVRPKPSRAVLSFVGGFGDGVGSVFFLTVSFGVGAGFGRRRLGLAVPEDSPVTLPVTLGRVVINAPRTSSSCWANVAIDTNPAAAIIKLRKMTFTFMIEILLQKIRCGS
jgi:hypothetical protein